MYLVIVILKCTGIVFSTCVMYRRRAPPLTNTTTSARMARVGWRPSLARFGPLSTRTRRAGPTTSATPESASSPTTPIPPWDKRYRYDAGEILCVFFRVALLFLVFYRGRIRISLYRVCIMHCIGWTVLYCVIQYWGMMFRALQGTVKGTSVRGMSRVLCRVLCTGVYYIGHCRVLLGYCSVEYRPRVLCSVK